MGNGDIELDEIVPIQKWILGTSEFPNLGSSTIEAQTKVAVAVAKQMADYLKHGWAVNAVNKPLK